MKGRKFFQLLNVAFHFTQMFKMSSFMEMQFHLFVSIIHCSALENIHLGLTGFYAYYAPPYQIYKLGSAMNIALDTIRDNSSILENVTLSYVFADDGCSEKTSLGALVTLVRDHHIDAVIGPSCSGSGRGIGKLSSYWNVPVVAYSGTTGDLSDKTIYDTYSRVVSIGPTGGFVMTAVVEAMDWDKLCIYMRDEAYLLHLRDGIVQSASARNITVLKPILPILTETLHYDQVYDSGYYESSRRKQRPSMKQLKSFCRGKIYILKATMFIHYNLQMGMAKQWFFM